VVVAMDTVALNLAVALALGYPEGTQALRPQIGW
jgi:hypothetical protein